MRRTFLIGLLLAGMSASMASSSRAAAPDSTSVEYLIPEMRGQGLALSDGPRPYLRRLSFSPAFGQLGSEPYYLLRLAFNPSRFLGYEAAVGHNPAQSVHSLVHTLNIVARWPFEGRLQPYVTAGYGMMLIFPGRVFSADPVTANQLSAGAGLEVFLRNDVAIRGEWKGHHITNGQNDRFEGGRNYREFSFGLAFYRDIGR